MRSQMKKPPTLWLVLFMGIGAGAGAILAYAIGERSWLTARMYIYGGGAAGGILAWLLSPKRS